MDLEEEAEIEICPRFAYGCFGNRSPLLPEVPPNAKLIYNVVLKSIQIESDIDELSYNEKRRIGYIK
jgi:hypothetical protein